MRERRALLHLVSLEELEMLSTLARACYSLSQLHGSSLGRAFCTGECGQQICQQMRL
jgi:hypothetical protein